MSEIAESKKPENLPAGFKFPGKEGGGAMAEDFDYGSSGSDVDEDEDEGGAGGAGGDASGLSGAENRIVSQVCEMGFDRAAVVSDGTTSLLFASLFCCERGCGRVRAAAALPLC